MKRLGHIIALFVELLKMKPSAADAVRAASRSSRRPRSLSDVDVSVLVTREPVQAAFGDLYEFHGKAPHKAPSAKSAALTTETIDEVCSIGPNRDSSVTTLMAL